MNPTKEAEAGSWFPTSFAQRMFWLLEQIEPDTPAYNLPRMLRVRGKLDTEALRGSFLGLIRRYEALRTNFIEQDGEILQEVHRHVSIDLPCRDLSHLPAAEARAEALRLAAEEGRKVFDLGRAPLLRLLLLRLGPEEHLLVLVIHHIVTDGWSMSIIFEEIAEFYESCATGRQLDLPSLPLQYSDFARWQQEHLTDETLAADIDYWKGNLRGSPDLLELPADHRRPAIQTHRGSLHSSSIAAPLTARLKDACTREGATLFMGLLATFQMLLSRYSGSQDILVGTPVAGRNDPDLAKLIGCFVNTLVMRTDLSGACDFQQVLKRVREMALSAYAHQDLPFERLLTRLRPERNRSHTPLFQVMFILQNAPKQVVRMPGLEIEELEFDSGLAKFDLTLEVVEQEDGLYCQFEYSRDLFEPPTIARMAQHFVNLLSAALDAPTVPVSQLPLLTDAERERMLVEWNRTEADYPRDLRLEHAFEAQLRRTPDAVALIDAGRSITYAELDRRANKIAHALLNKNMPSDAPVGVHLGRSAEAFAAILGILKTGHAYVPLDVSQPAARLRRLVADCGCCQILTMRDLVKALPETVETILLDPDSAVWTGHRETPLSAGANSGLAYVIYTSGSTGEPKGVMGTHRATINRFEWMYRAYPFASGEVCCQKTALGFVDSIWEMFGPLLRGVPNLIVPDDHVVDPERLLALLAREGVTRIVLVPTLLRVLLEHAPDLGARVPRLKLWTTSGEYLPDDLARRFRTACPDAVLLNLYGSSEVAADVTWHEVRALGHNEPVPIGKPISNTQVYILDQYGAPVPIGVTGQVHVGGDCLCAGYWRRPDLTAERFPPNPFGKNSSVLFATGDQGRFLADGSIEYLGRRDGQVKIRGYRIELGEVEAHLAAHPGVRQAVLAALAGPEADSRQLVAYVVGQDGTMPAAEELRAFLRGRLPQYMVPAVFVDMRELPLLPSGKIDRRALPPPAADATSAPRPVAPRNETETRLAAIWCELLHLPEVGVTQNFFDLGGHSLLAMQVLARIRKQFEVDVSIRSLFDAATIEGLALEVEKARVSGAAPRLRAIRQRHEPRMDALAAELGKLSPEQIEMLLQQVRRT
ncbi:amino acid adenylation domain-containing protein [Belnapia sp. T18]|uniref:Amino acid adenylation domain-containing protein n=1 Tax=Belnapia arida TaxID=2804533 RepID=A0ABS1U2F1_9PROT|nr:non-ribosomal peptide synthetase [Belnapia arida]MBL6078114.1 amino acid adenylation domain-containing protein [Belnapia arida]